MKPPFLSPNLEGIAEWQFRCTSCGQELDVDHNWCEECEDHSGDWELCDLKGDPYKAQDLQ